MSNTRTVQVTTPGDRDIVMTREFDAPRRLVFDAWTKPELLVRWLDARGRKLDVRELDLRVGGRFHFVWHGEGKKDVGVRGTYREIVDGERLVHVENWTDWDTGETTVTTEFVERNGRTSMTATMRYPSRDVRDAVLKSGMEGGAGESYENLDRLLAALAASAI